MTMTPTFKYTMPIEKAEQREDGYYIVGLASGPEIDKDGERIAPEGIARFAEQINARVAKGDPIPYRDAHLKDGVLIDLGYIVKGWIDPEFHLGIEVRLDEDNPAAMSLYKQLKKGKQYGMSVAGRVVDFTRTFVQEVGKSVTTFRDVELAEISNTTRPVWTPSFGTVLSKAIDAAQDAESSVAKGENPVDDTELLSTQDDTTPAAEEAVDEAQKAESEEAAPEAATEDTTEKAEETADDDLEKAGKTLSAKTRAALLASYQNITETLQSIGVLEAEQASEDVTEDSAKSDSPDAEDVEKAETGSDPRDAQIAELTAAVDELRKSLTEMTARVQELQDTPAGHNAPPVITKSDEEAEKFLETFKALPASERIRLSLAARTSGQ
jgi:hypothetical protein